MKDFLGFTRRNLIIYFKDILAIFFSLLTSIIVFVLYLLFLKGTFVDALEATMNGLENFVSGGDVDMLANGILLRDGRSSSHTSRHPHYAHLL